MICMALRARQRKTCWWITVGLVVTLFIFLQLTNIRRSFQSVFTVHKLRTAEESNSFVHPTSDSLNIRDEEGEKYKARKVGQDFPDEKTNFRIIVITYKRQESLLRLLTSLNGVYFYGDNIVVDVWIDRSKSGIIHAPTYTTATQFEFKYGKYNVYNHSNHVGIYGQWLDTWQPPKNNEIAVILEDDLTVSKFLYKWLKNVHKKYDKKPEVCGYSLQGYSIKHGGGPGSLRAPHGHCLFTYPVIGTWGFSPKRENWQSFLKWYRESSKDKNFKPFVPGIEPSRWYEILLKKGKSDTMWSMWHIYYTWKYRELVVYPNLLEGRGLTINWKESGLHYNSHQTKKHSDPLLTQWNQNYDYSALPEEPIHLDVHGKVSPKDKYI